jgi:hypothetical protein
MDNKDKEDQSGPRRRARMAFLQPQGDNKKEGQPDISKNKKKEFMNQEKRTKLGQELIEKAENWDFEGFQRMVSEPDVPLNYREPTYKGTIIHTVANFGSLRMYEALLRRESELDFLARDWKGRLASELAAKHSDRNNLSDLLIERELAAAAQIGATITPRQTIFADGTFDPADSQDIVEPIGP